MAILRHMFKGYKLDEIDETVAHLVNSQDRKIIMNGIEWGQPVPFDEYILPRFPVDIFPEWIRNYIQSVAESTQTPVDMASMAALSVLSISMAKKLYVKPVDSWIEGVNIYTLTLMGPANRKSSVFEHMSKPVTEFEMELREELELIMKNRNDELKMLVSEKEKVMKSDMSFSERNAQIKEINKKLKETPEINQPVYVVDDVTPEVLVTLLKQNQERLGILSAEGGIFEMIKGRYNGQVNLEVYLKAHSGDRLRVDRRDREEVLDSPALSVGLFAQPDIIQNLPSSFNNRGLMARFLYSLPKDFRGYRKIRPKVMEDKVKKQYFHYLKKLMRYGMTDTGTLVERKIIQLGCEADILLQQYQEDIEIMLREGGELSDMPEWGGKLVGQIVRIATMLHVANAITHDDIPEELNDLALKNAIKTSDYFIQHAKAAFGQMEVDQDGNNAKYLLRVLLRSDNSKVTKQRLWQLVKKKFKQAKTLNNALAILEDRHYIRRHKEGRKELIEVNPYS
jgi:replicative DNA helicase